VKGKTFTSFLSARRTRGVALFISLVLLLVLTIIGVSSVQTSSLETRMARNEHDSLLAFQAAESALRDAENFLLTINTVEDTEAFTSGGAGGLWNVSDPGLPERWEPAANWSGGGSVVAATEVGEVVAEAPRFMIEHLANIKRLENPYQLNPDYPDPNGRVAMFRITARGVGGSANARVLLQSTFGRLID
jgi:type IV pilus assembly protein PilX